MLSLCSSIRSPGPVTPRDVECEGFNLTYPRIANDKLNTIPGAHSALEYDVDKKVDSSITTFLTSLSQIGPELLSVSNASWGQELRRHRLSHLIHAFHFAKL
jgi:hypothetical protein